jgi:hypothetical protein
MNGGKGDDTYFVDNTGDVVTDTLPGADGGIDAVNSSVSFTLAATLENLILTGTTPINGTGNALDNQITGNRRQQADGLTETTPSMPATATTRRGGKDDSIIGARQRLAIRGKYRTTIDDPKQLEESSRHGKRELTARIRSSRSTPAVSDRQVLQQPSDGHHGQPPGGHRECAGRGDRHDHRGRPRPHGHIQAFAR